MTEQAVKKSAFRAILDMHNEHYMLNKGNQRIMKYALMPLRAPVYLFRLAFWFVCLSLGRFLNFKNYQFDNGPTGPYITRGEIARLVDDGTPQYVKDRQKRMEKRMVS